MRRDGLARVRAECRLKNGGSDASVFVLGVVAGARIIATVKSIGHRMSLVVRKTPNGLYEATAMPPHIRTTWSTTEPIPASRLIEEPKARGCHQQDIADAMYEQDQDWIEKL
jgi:hypothetical protein